MPEGWTKKDENMYEAVKNSQLAQGRSLEEAMEIAGRTVNKQRRREGRTPKKTTSGTGNPNTPLDQRSKQELYNRARQLEIEGRSNMTKADLIAAIRRRQ